MKYKTDFSFRQYCSGCCLVWLMVVILINFSWVWQLLTNNLLHQYFKTTKMDLYDVLEDLERKVLFLKGNIEERWHLVESLNVKFQSFLHRLSLSGFNRRKWVLWVTLFISFLHFRIMKTMLNRHKILFMMLWPKMVVNIHDASAFVNFNVRISFPWDHSWYNGEIFSYWGNKKKLSRAHCHEVVEERLGSKL